MKNVLILLVLLAAAYFIWARFAPQRPAAANNPNTTPGANATQRIDNLSGAAPQ